MLKLIYFFLGYFLFLLFGALIFYELNTVEERKRHINVNNRIRQFLNRNRKCLKESDLHNYVDYFLDKSHTGLWQLTSSKENIPKWTFGQGLFFVTSLLTTVGYGAPNLITSYGKCICIIYTSIGLIFALFYQQVLHRQLIPKIYSAVHKLSINRYFILYASKNLSYLVSFLCITFLIIFFFIIIPTLLIHDIYVPEWTYVELTYFLVTTNHLIGFGDLMPCSDSYGQARSTCATIMSIYVIVQIITAGILSHMFLIFPRKSHQILNQRRHSSDPTIHKTNNKNFLINVNDR